MRVEISSRFWFLKKEYLLKKSSLAERKGLTRQIDLPIGVDYLGHLLSPAEGQFRYKQIDYLNS